MTEKELEINLPSSEEILVAYEKLFEEDSDVHRFKASGLRYIDLPGSLRLIEQNPEKDSHWAKMAREGHDVAWVMKDGDYLARIVDGNIVVLHHN